MRRALLALCLLGCGPPAEAPVAPRASVAPAPVRPPPRPPRVAVTIDDLPWVGGARADQTRVEGVASMIAAAERRGAPLAGFFTCSRGEGREAARREWLSSGLTLGNHSTSHRALDDLGLEAWRADVAGCQRALEAAAGRRVRYFRYPFLRTGDDAALRDAGFAFLAELGVRRAPVTIDTSEWALVRPYLAALRAGDDDAARAIGDAYVDHVRRAARRYVALADRDAPHVLLLHANALAADHLGRLLDGLRADGLTFASLDDVLAHPLYARDDLYVGPVGLSWLYRVEPGRERAWAWDAAQLHALRVRFEGAAERAAFDLDHDLRVRRVAPRTWVATHEEPWPANSLVAQLEDGTVLLVDTPYTEGATRALLDWVDARFGPGPRVAINTHSHPDALGGNGALAAASIPIYGTEQTARRAVETRESMRSRLAADLRERPEVAAAFADYAPPPPDHRFAREDGLRLSLGEPVEVIYPGPAHSPDNVVVWLPARRLLFGGCMVSGTGRLGSLVDASPPSWRAAMARLLGLNPARVVPGHGDRFEPEILEQTLALLEALEDP